LRQYAAGLGIPSPRIADLIYTRFDKTSSRRPGLVYSVTFGYTPRPVVLNGVVIRLIGLVVILVPGPAPAPLAVVSARLASRPRAAAVAIPALSVAYRIAQGPRAVFFPAELARYEV
jgi:hypothetical protein